MEGPEPKIVLVIRGFANGNRKPLFEDRMERTEEEIGGWLMIDAAAGHALALADYERYMIEIEFLDEADPSRRFFRFGTDPSMMIDPMLVPAGAFETDERPN